MSQNREIDDEWAQIDASKVDDPYSAFRAGWLAAERAREQKIRDMLMLDDGEEI